MSGFTSLRIRLVGTVFLAVAPAAALLYFTRFGHVELTGFIIGLVALAAAWYGGERFILRQVRVISRAAQRLAAGDFKSRAGMAHDNGEFGELARLLDAMASALEKRASEREENEKNLLHRSLQQTVIGALGQFALVSKELPPLVNQTVMLVAQTLEVEYCHFFEMQPDGQSLLLRAGVGWKEGLVENAVIESGKGTEADFVLIAGQPIVIEHLPSDRRFVPEPLFLDHGIVSGVTVALNGKNQAFGLLGAYTSNRRKFTEDEVHFMLSAGTLLAMAMERHRAEAEIYKLAAFAQLNPNPAMELNADGELTYFNEAALKLAYSVGEDNPQGILPADIYGILTVCLETSESLLRYETKIKERTLSWSFHPVVSARAIHVYVEDVTERLSLEAQLRQSQKMESVGQLAAGVAHDFNNMLTIIQGHAGMLLAKPSLPPEFADSIQAAYFAAERAAGLTRQLLMFSRKNVMLTKGLDLREVVTQMSKMLERLIGETIKLELKTPERIPLVEGDAGMIEQVLMNLAVNARDAMPKGGSLTISLNPVAITEYYAATHADATPGTFVCLRVTDTGFGMDAATMRRIFEPFFTTKEVGKGTGLGLATVYGIVKQHGGWIDVTSEVNKGTTFNVFWPASEEFAAESRREVREETAIQGGKETILVVEDEPVLRDLANLILTDCGYQVLEAATGSAALRLWEKHRGNIHLLLTDMVMPEGMSGMDLAERLVAERPNLKIIFASGYSMDDLDTDFVQQGHAMFLQKPYTHVTLAKAVRDCLDKADVGHSTGA